MKKTKKAVDLWELYLSQFIAEIRPEDFKKILNHEHEVLDVVDSNGILILKLKSNADTEHKNYEFFKSKVGMRIKCIGDYYKLDNSQESGHKIRKFF